METSKKRVPGSIKISEGVIVKIAETAVREIDGAVIGGRSGRSARPGRPVRVRMLGESAAIHLAITVAEGFNAASVAESVQRSVKSAVQNMSGLTVTKVDVSVMGVEFPDSAGTVQQQG